MYDFRFVRNCISMCIPLDTGYQRVPPYLFSKLLKGHYVEVMQPGVDGEPKLWVNCSVIRAEEAVCRSHTQYLYPLYVKQTKLARAGEIRTTLINHTIFPVVLVIIVPPKSTYTV